MKLLRLTPTLKSTTTAYNQFSLGFKDKINQTVGSLQKDEVPIDEKIAVFHGDGSFFRLFKLIKRNINQVDYDVVHVHNSITGIIFILAIFPFKLGLLKKTVFTLHNSWEVFKTRNQFLNIIVMLLSRKVCTCGQSSQQSLPKIISYLFGKKTKAVINGFDNRRIDRVASNKSGECHFDTNSKIKIVYVGALTDTKNQMALLKVLNSANIKAEIIFLGDGVNKQSLIDYSKSISNSSTISFKGCVSRDETIEHMLEADVFISLSKGEGLPIAVLEAMYCGCFLILSTIPPHKEISPPRERCLFVDISNEKEITNSLNYVRHEIVNLKGQRDISKHHSIQNFSLDNMLEGYMEVYKSLLSGIRRS
jgi:glycosyltransferase involved in cell wall biosynthesis